MAKDDQLKLTVITSVSIALFLLLWGLIDCRLKTLETRMRGVELQVTRISEKLGINVQLSCEKLDKSFFKAAQ